MAATAVLPPSLAVEIAWGISNEFSKDTEAKLLGEVAKVDLERLVQSANTSGTDKEKRYVNGTATLIDGALRTLHIVVAGRDLNIDALDELRSKRREDIEASAKLSGSLQSIAPRAVSTLFVGGAAGAGLSEALTRWAGIHATDVALFQGLVIAAAAAAGYVTHALIIAPLVRRGLTRELIKKDYDRTLYFDQYYERCYLVLFSLCERVNNWHEAVFGGPFPDTNAREVANRALSGAQSTPCLWVHNHMRNGWVTPDLWSLCETGGIKLDAVKSACPVYRKRETD
jgi:hypothetical protein